VIKHALAVAIVGMGFGFIGPAPVHAASPLSGVGASSINAADNTVVKVAGPCLELPVVLNVVAFIELLADEEFDRHCNGRFDGGYEYQRTYEERKYPTYKDGGYEEPKDLKAMPR
jgi:hypothetical protein